MAYVVDNPWPGMIEPYASVVREKVEGKGTLSRNTYISSVEVFLAWAWRVYGRDLNPSEVTPQICFEFLAWIQSDDQDVDIRHDLINIRNPQWEPLWRVTCQLYESGSRPPTMLDVYRSMSREDLSHIARSESTQIQDVRDALRVFVRRMNRLVRQEPSGVSIYEQILKARKSGGVRPPTIGWERIRLIPKPRAHGTASYALGTAKVLRSVWYELGFNPENNPWVEPTRQYVPHAKQSKKRKAKATSPDVQALLANPDARTLKGARDFAMFAAMTFWGVRTTELVAIKRSDIVLMHDGIVRVRLRNLHAEGERFVILTQRMQRALDRLGTLLLERVSREKGPMKAWATAVTQPDAPLFPALHRWHPKSKNLPHGAPMNKSAISFAVSNHVSGVTPGSVRQYWLGALRKSGSKTPEIFYLSGKKQKAYKETTQEAADRSIMMVELWITQEAKLVW